MSDTINRQSLSEEFDIEDVNDIEIETFKSILGKVKEVHNPNNVLSAIVEKASTFVDMIERECVNGGMSARYVEVAAQLINSLVTTSTAIATINSTYFNDDLKVIKSKQKDKEIEQKDRELDIKELYYQDKKQIEGGKGNQNIIVSSREDILRFLENKGK